VEVKPHSYVVLGDPRDASSDSRIWGLVPEKYIYGKALFRYWPLGSASFISHESDYNVQPSAPANTAEPE
jgi:signal peptidase I